MIARLGLIAAVVVLGVGIAVSSGSRGLGRRRRRDRLDARRLRRATSPRRRRRARRSSPLTDRADARAADRAVHQRDRRSTSRSRVPAELAGRPEPPDPRLSRRCPARTPTLDPGGARSPTRRRTVIPVAADRRASTTSRATIVGPGGESDPSLAVRYVFDNVPPKITITSPKNNAIVNGKAVDDQGQDAGADHAPRTQRRQRLVDRRDGRIGRHLHAQPRAQRRGQQDHHRRAPIRPATPARSILTVKRGAGKLTVAAQRVRLPDQALASCPSR